MQLTNIINEIKSSITILNADLAQIAEPKSSLVKRSKQLKLYLQSIDNANKSYNIDHVLIEYQMYGNDKCRTIASQISYHYTKLTDHTAIKSFNNIDIIEPHESYDTQVHIVNPKLKNKIYYFPEGDLPTFIAKYSQKYTANKNHAKHNFAHWVTVFDQYKVVKKIPKKYYKDVGDAFLQANSWWKQYILLNN